jgi:hypothetical protein
MTIIDTTTTSITPTFNPPTIESEVAKFYGRTMTRYNEQGVDSAFAYFTGIIRTNLRDQNAVQMLVDRLPPEFAGKYEEVKRATQQARMQQEAEAKARAESEAAYQKELDAFWANNPPDALTELPEYEVDDAGELFDLLARYRITKIEFEYSERWHWDQFEGIESQGTQIWISDDFTIAIDELPDDAEIGIAEFLDEAIQNVAGEYAGKTPGKLGDDYGTVTFDVVAREISVQAEVEVKNTETFEESWSI